MRNSLTKWTSALVYAHILSHLFLSLSLCLCLPLHHLEFIANPCRITLLTSPPFESLLQTVLFDPMQYRHNAQANDHSRQQPGTVYIVCSSDRQVRNAQQTQPQTNKSSHGKFNPLKLRLGPVTHSRDRHAEDHDHAD